MKLNHDTDLFPIRVVTQKTGVNSVTLRAWERRYGLIKPQRTPKGHRLYSQTDINLINSVVLKLGQGHSISKISTQLVHPSRPDKQAENGDPWSVYRQRLIGAIAQFDEKALDSAYNEAMSLYPVEVVTQKLIQPLLEELGERWGTVKNQPDFTPVAEEHFFSVFIRNKLGARFHHRNIRNEGPKLVLACVPGEQHEFGLLLFALTAHDRGFRNVLLGADMPLEELPAVLQKTGANALVLSATESFDCDGLFPGLAQLTDDTAVPVYLGGEISTRSRARLTALGIELTGASLTHGITRLTKHFAL